MQVLINVPDNLPKAFYKMLPKMGKTK